MAFGATQSTRSGGPPLAVGPAVLEPGPAARHRELPDDEFRAALRTFLRERDPGRPPRAADERLRWHKAWLAGLVDAGWAGPSWPVAHGGLELSFAKQVIYAEETGRVRVPGPLGTGVGIAGPTIVAHGTGEQKERWLRPMLRGDVVWCQGYSEPDAGSDLPSLQTRAEVAGDHYVVTGRKLWSTAADLADVVFALVRTGPPGSREQGITYLIVDAHAPGVTIRPIRDLTGGADFGEIELDAVRVPVADRVGAEGEGWAVTRTSLGHERGAGALTSAARYRRIVDELVNLASSRGLAGDPVVRQDLADLQIRQRLLELGAARTIAGIVERGDPGPGSSVSRLATTTFEQRLHEVALRLLGADGLLGRFDPGAVERGRWTWGFLRTRASTIGAGTAEIQRNTIGERILGLPRDPAVQ
jgi:alkylation response protein AidB-like acyl-CoA dehydrogenase